MRMTPPRAPPRTEKRLLRSTPGGEGAAWGTGLCTWPPALVLLDASTRQQEKVDFIQFPLSVTV